MRVKWTTAFLAASALCSPAAAQTAVGIGTARSDSAATSRSQSVAIGGGNATARQAQGQSQTLNVGGAPATTTQSVHNSGSISNVPAVFAPGLSAAGLETCLGSVSVGASWLGTGLTGGGSIPDTGCAARLDARTLWSMGLKRQAIARLCLNPDINNSMPDVCATYMPRPTPAYAPTVFGTRVAAAESPPSYRGGPILLVEGATGRERLCNNYDEPGQRCKTWATVVVHTVPKPKPRPAVPVTAQVEVKPAASQEDKSK